MPFSLPDPFFSDCALKLAPLRIKASNVSEKLSPLPHRPGCPILCSPALGQVALMCSFLLSMSTNLVSYCAVGSLHLSTCCHCTTLPASSYYVRVSVYVALELHSLSLKTVVRTLLSRASGDCPNFSPSRLAEFLYAAHPFRSALHLTAHHRPR
jgi:hypothetical protein